MDKAGELADVYLDADHVGRTLTAYEEMYKPYMENYYKRYGGASWEWDTNIRNIRRYFDNRAEYILRYIEQNSPDAVSGPVNDTDI